ncbi:MAG TPA: S8 family serine peptidase, partial [Chitinophagaceae bacterium]|nr:S8 family serine peptidase [Chitinophagaceae bacterium]
MNKLMKQSGLLSIAVIISMAVSAQVPKGWHTMDKETSGYFGISLQKAYDFLQAKKLKSHPVLVAVIDSGVDTTHEDLKPILWRNPNEIPGNGIDDDKNGYVDDIYGWNFLGSHDDVNKNVETDSYEAVRVYHNLKSKYEGKDIDESKLSPQELDQYKMWQRAKQEVVGDVNPLEVLQLKNMFKTLSEGDSIIRTDLKKDEYSCKDLQNYTTENEKAQKVKDILERICKVNDNNDISNQMILDQLQNDLNKMEAA